MARFDPDRIPAAWRRQVAKYVLSAARDVPLTGEDDGVEFRLGLSEPDGDESHIDIFTGDPSYDQWHNPYTGGGFVAYDASFDEALQAVDDALEEVAEQVAEDLGSRPNPRRRRKARRRTRRYR